MNATQNPTPDDNTPIELDEVQGIKDYFSSEDHAAAVAAARSNLKGKPLASSPQEEAPQPKLRGNKA